MTNGRATLPTLYNDGRVDLNSIRGRTYCHRALTRENVEGIEGLSITKCGNTTGKIHKLTFVIELPKLTDEDEKKLAESYRAAQDAT